MNYIIDNTIADPDAVEGFIIGSSFLVPATGGAGVWVNKEDQIATWGGVFWSFSEPIEGAQYQVTSGPNAGLIFVRTNVVSKYTNLIPNGDLEANTSGYPNWTLSQVAGGSAAWAAGAVYLDSNGTGDSAKALATFTAVVGTTYRILFELDSVTVGAPDSTANYKLRNVTAGADVVTGTLTVPGETEFTFVALSTAYSLAIEVVSSAAEPGQVVILSAGCYRVEQLVTNGGFTGGLTGWTAPSPWTAGTDTAEAEAPIGHPALPTLQQNITALTIGQYYRIDFDVSGTFDYGSLSVYFDGVVLRDTDASGHWSLYFKATATSHLLQFPLSQRLGFPFEVVLDNVSMMAALWVANPMLKATIDLTSGMAVASSRAWNVPVRVDVSTGMVVAAATTRPGAFTFSPTSNLRAAAYKTSVRDGRASFALQASTGSRASSSKDGRVTFSLSSNLTVTPEDLGFFTVKNAVDSIISLWTYLGVSCSSSTCSQIQLEALEPLNAAMQKLHASGQEWGYVSTVALSISPVGGSTEIVLPRNVIHVKRCIFKPSLNTGATTFASLPLRPLRTRHECEAFRLSTPSGIWPLSTAESSLTGKVLPLGYFTEAEDASDGSSSPALRLLFAPEFTDPITWKVDLQVAVGPPRYRCSDILGGTRLQIPERYAETLLMPLARYYALSSRNFTKPELKESVVAQATEVLALLGELQPAQPEAAKDTKRR